MNMNRSNLKKIMNVKIEFSITEYQPNVYFTWTIDVD